MTLGLNENAKKPDPKKVNKTTDEDDAKAILEQMQAKEDNGDCAFC